MDYAQRAKALQADPFLIDSLSSFTRTNVRSRMFSAEDDLWDGHIATEAENDAATLQWKINESRENTRRERIKREMEKSAVQEKNILEKAFDVVVDVIKWTPGYKISEAGYDIARDIGGKVKDGAKEVVGVIGDIGSGLGGAATGLAQILQNWQVILVGLIIFSILMKKL